jgi:hypothetical protein
MRPTIAIAVTALLLLVAGCGDDSTVESSEPQPAAETATVHHIHGLGVGAESAELFVATHSGLFVAGDGEQQLRQVGDSEQDIMGFSVVGPTTSSAQGTPTPATPARRPTSA